MAQVRPEVKEKLVADGRWPDFVRYRKELTDGGLKPSVAFDIAIARICPEFAAESRAKRGRPRVVREPVDKDIAELRNEIAEVAQEASDEADLTAKARTEARMSEAAKLGEEIEAERRRKQKEGLVGKDVFAGKPKVGAADEVLWVAKNLTVDVGPEDAPGELAWNFLVLCRESADFKVKFMLNIASDVVKRRSDEEDGDGKKWDGVKQYDLCEAMREAQV
jgi:hypothetical protein